ncbi:hypothetical protein E2C01_037849 [Portunus trituberculatus]|uniref:Uncharacterized protein n=1 Tax=Portunus trituberculatus TaxID=210409 RepID=A0A5B7FIB0_PORTR|nr:hypothetical protein [Portunus trituberculatus]
MLKCSHPQPLASTTCRDGEKEKEGVGETSRMVVSLGGPFPHVSSTSSSQSWRARRGELSLTSASLTTTVPVPADRNGKGTVTDRCVFALTLEATTVCGHHLDVILWRCFPVQAAQRSLNEARLGVHAEYGLTSALVDHILLDGVNNLGVGSL